MRVSFVDTSIVCNMVPVPGRDQHRADVLTELAERRAAGQTLILPVTAVVETGNFIAQVADGRLRRSAATTFSGLMQLVAAGKAPWKLHEFMWGRTFLDKLLTGGGTGMSLIEHAVNEFGAGDLCILTERLVYQSRSTLDDVSIWTRDEKLTSYS